MQNVHSVRLLGYIVEDTVRAKHDLSQRPPSSSGICRPNEWELGQDPNMIKDAIAHSQGGFCIMSSDVGANTTQIRDRLIGPDYFEVHAVAQDLSKS
jgi:hypothetical protein